MQRGRSKQRSAPNEQEMYVSRAGNKLASISTELGLDFRGKTVLDVGSSTGGFSDFVLKQGAAKVVAVEKGSRQMDPLLRHDPRVELYEKTDIRHFNLVNKPDIILADLSFVSLRDIIPALVKFMDKETQLVVMAKPQFESLNPEDLNRGVVKNERIRRGILKDLETHLKKHFLIINKADSKVAGAKGNRERFYLLKIFK